MSDRMLVLMILLTCFVGIGGWLVWFVAIMEMAHD